MDLAIAIGVVVAFVTFLFWASREPAKDRPWPHWRIRTLFLLLLASLIAHVALGELIVRSNLNPALEVGFRLVLIGVLLFVLYIFFGGLASKERNERKRRDGAAR